jgi:hypothetical protein
VSPAAQRVAAERFEATLARAAATQRHVWVAMLTHLMDDVTARMMCVGQEHTDVVFGLSTLAATNMGCFLCEQPLRPGLVGGRCPGEPP